MIVILCLVFGLGGCKPGSINNSPATATHGALAPVVLKVMTRQAGIVEIGAQELLRAGMDLSALDSQPVYLYWRGIPLPVWVDGAAGQLRFFAWESQSVYSQENVYWLVQGDESSAPDAAYWRIQEQNPPEMVADPAQALVKQDELPPGAFAAVVHLEENTQYFSQVEQGDHWLWAPLAAPQNHEFEVSLPQVVAAPGAIRAAVWARTEGPGDVDHHLQISINGSLVVDHSWDGKGRHEIIASVPAGVWKTGANTIRFDAPGDTGNLADVVLVDWIDVVSGQKFQAQNDRLYFLSAGQPQSLVGFTPPIHGYDVTNPLKPMRLSLAMLAGNTFAGEPGHVYWLVGARGGLAPEVIAAPDESPNLRANTSGAEYIAIGPPDLLAPLQPLLDFRSQNGLSVMAVPLQSVFDQFNGGIPEPEAIRSFLRYASQHWQSKPRYILLVGDATYDPRGYQAPPEANRLPVFLVDTDFGGETGSDVMFSLLDDDQLPDLAVGRIPARTAEQVRVVVEKTLDYAQQPAGAEWKQRVLAVADGQEAAFQSDAQYFLALFPDDVQTDILAPAAGETAVNQQIVERLNQGDGLIAYFGHGSVSMWGKDRLFSTEDVPSLKNTGRYPIMINLTCLTGLFTHPKVESLAEAMLWQPGAGAVVVLAPTSLTLPGDQSFLYQPLVDSLLSQPGITLGEALLYARRQIPTGNSGSMDVMETFLLFGDPALQIDLQ